MKILIVTQYFWPEVFKINDLALGLLQQGHEITVLTGKPNYPEGKYYKGYNFFNRKTEYYNGIKVIRSPLLTRGRGNGLRLFLNYLSFAFFASLTAAFRLKKNNEIIFVYEPSPVTVGIPAIVYRFFTGSPIFFWVQDLWPESIKAAGGITSGFILRIVEKIVKHIYKKSSVIYISSKSFRESIIEKGVNDNKIKYLPNWAEDLYLQKVDRNMEIYSLIPKGGFNIMFAGNIGESQDFNSILLAAENSQHYGNINWIIIGDGRKKKWAEQQVKRNNIKNIFFLGKYPMNTMPYFFREADALLVTLKNDYVYSLTLPAKVQSYLACGKPILAMLNGEGADIINESKAGFVVSAGDHMNLSLKAHEMSVLTRARLDEMSKAAESYYLENFDRSTLVNNLIRDFLSYLSN